MNNELRDPLEKVSNSLRRAVSINRSRETDLRSTMNTIQRERRRSFNTWSLKQEKFLRAKQKLVPAMTFNQASRAGDKQPTRRVTLVRAVSPVALAAAAAKRTKCPEIKLPSIASNLMEPGRGKARSKKDIMPPVITLATTSQFFQENQRTRRISDHRQPKASITGQRGWGELENAAIERKGQLRKLTTVSHRSLPHTATRTETETGTKEDLSKQPIKDIAEERSSSNELDRRKRKREESEESNSKTSEQQEPRIGLVVKEQGSKAARGQWNKVRDSLKQITGKKPDINRLSMMELTKLFEEIRECRYLRVGTHSRFTTNSTDHTMKTCKCLACTVVDKNKLKNNLSAPK